MSFLGLCLGGKLLIFRLQEGHELITRPGCDHSAFYLFEQSMQTFLLPLMRPYSITVISPHSSHTKLLKVWVDSFHWYSNTSEMSMMFFWGAFITF